RRQRPVGPGLGVRLLGLLRVCRVHVRLRVFRVSVRAGVRLAERVGELGRLLALLLQRALLLDRLLALQLLERLTRLLLGHSAHQDGSVADQEKPPSSRAGKEGARSANRTRSGWDTVAPRPRDAAGRASVWRLAFRRLQR